MVEYIPRLHDWRSRLVGAIEPVRREPFKWGAHDCGFDWAGRAVEAMTGVDVTQKFRGRGYSTAKGAYALIKRAGFDNLGDLAASVLPEIPVCNAILGDIAAIKTDDTGVGYALGIVNGATILVIGETGMQVIDLMKAERAFAVGERYT